jgi:hypothetical protein
MADNDVLQAIQIIDDKIASLQTARNQLARAFGIESKASLDAIVAVARVTSSQRSPSIQPSNGNGHHAPTGRKVELAKFLLAHGPASRVTIIEKAGLPEGTVSYCLSDKRFFVQSADGNWNINEYSRRGLERGSHNGTFEAEPN